MRKTGSQPERMENGADREDERRHYKSQCVARKTRREFTFLDGEICARHRGWKIMERIGSIRKGVLSGVCPRVVARQEIDNIIPFGIWHNADNNDTGAPRKAKRRILASKHIPSELGARPNPISCKNSVGGNGSGSPPIQW